MYFGHLQYRRGRRGNQQSGYMLIVVIFLMTALAISALAITASIKEQIQRDHEDEMIHRGVQYARAIKRYYKKFGRYPATLEALEDTNHVRFLRQRYKDPLTKDGKWLLVRYGQIQMGSMQGGGGLNVSGQPGLPNVPGVTGMLQGQSPTGQSSFGQSSFGQSSSFGNSSFGNSNFGQNSSGQGSIFGGGNSAQPQQTTTLGDTGVNTTANAGAAGTGTTGDTGTTGTPGTGTPGQNLGQNANGLVGTGVMGGGAIIGVASASKEQSLRIVAEKNHYNEWYFVYDPTLDRGGLIKGPYDPKKALGQFAGGMTGGQQIGTPAGQAGNGSAFGNSSFGNSSFGNSGNSFGNSGFGQQQQPQQPSQPQTSPQ